MENPRILAPALLAVAALTACAAPPPPMITATPQAAPAPKPQATPEVPPPAPTATAAAAAPQDESVVRMYPVAKIESLLDVTSTEAGVELRLGNDPGAGSVATYRYVPIVNGAPDLEQQTSKLTYVNTAVIIPSAPGA